jgi:hypothetical protein
MREICETCKFWNVDQRTDYITDTHECRWRPPVLRNSDVLPRVTYSAFPQTCAEWWCGCWQASRSAEIKTTRKSKKQGT